MERLKDPIWIHFTKRGIVVLLGEDPDTSDHWELRFWNWRSISWWKAPARLAYRIIDDEQQELSVGIDSALAAPRPRLPTAGVSS